MRCMGPMSTFSSLPHKKFDLLGSADPRKVNFSMQGVFSNHFMYQGAHGATSAVTGQYDVVTEADVKSVPEGFSGEINAEFEVHGDNETDKLWMIRDSSKLICKILDNFKAKSGTQPAREVSTSQRRVNLEDYGLRSDIEWHDAVMSVDYYGKELLGKPKINMKSGGDMYLASHEGDLVESYMHKIKEEVPEVPDRILLTGIVTLYVTD